MPEDNSNDLGKEIPVIPAPLKNDMDDSAEQESAMMSSGNLELTVQGSKRKMKAYTITSTEFASLDSWSTVKNRAYATSFSLFSFAIGLAVQAVFSGFSKLSPFAQAICSIGVPLTLVLGFVSLSIAKYLSKNSDGVKKIVEDETAHDNS